MDAVKAALDPSVISELHEVADGMLKIYRTLARMQFIEDAWIEEGPHDMTPWLPICHRLGIDNCIIYLYSILPYVINHGMGDLEFYRGGDFLDFRDERTIEEGRNPMYNEDEKGHMRSWMTSLSGVGNEATALLYDAKWHHIGIYAFYDHAGSDPNLHKQEYCERDEQTRWKIEVEGWVSDRSSDEDEDENEKEEEEEDDEENYWDEMHGRSAPFVLRDIVSWYEDLSEVPGGSAGYPRWDIEVVKPLYIKHGWPHAFKSDAFLIDQAIAYTFVSKEDRHESLTRWIENHKRFLSRDEDKSIQEARKTIADDSADVDALWLARWRIWDMERYRAETERQLREAEAAYALPVDEQLWQIERLRDEINSERRNRQKYHEKLLSRDESDEPATRWNTPEALGANRDYHEKYFGVYERAYKAFRAEVGGDSFFTDRGIVEAEIENGSDIRAQRRREEAEAIRVWLLQVPEEAVSARECARKSIESALI